MTSVITIEWLEARRTAKMAAIVAFEEAILALALGAQSYTLDTGQTRIVKTQANLSELRKTLAELEAQLEALDARIAGFTATYVRPAY